jgi:hypothetical protein
MADEQQKLAPAGSESFWTRYRDFIIAIVVLAAIFGFLVLRDRSQEREVQREPSVAEEQQGTTTAQDSMAKDEESRDETRMEEDRITVTAARGDGYTHLARKALAEYLEQNQDQATKLTREHKIYIEDLLQKQVPNKQKLRVGSEHTFTVDEIEGAIDRAGDLTTRQLEHLKVFSAKVKNL